MKKILLFLSLLMPLGILANELTAGLLIHNNTDIPFRLHEYSRGTQAFQDKIFGPLSRILQGSRILPARTEVWLKGNISLCENGFISLTDQDKNTVHIIVDKTDCSIQIKPDFAIENAVTVVAVPSDNGAQVRIYMHSHVPLQADPGADFPLDIDKPDFAVDDEWPIPSKINVSNFLDKKVSSFFINKEDCQGEFILGDETISDICHGELIEPEENFTHKFVNTLKERGVLIYSESGKKMVDYISLVTESFLLSGNEKATYVLTDSAENLDALNYRLPVYIYQMIDGNVDVQTFLDRLWDDKKDEKDD